MVSEQAIFTLLATLKPFFTQVRVTFSPEINWSRTMLPITMSHFYGIDTPGAGKK